MSDQFDVAIVGGGLVGTSMACALDQLGLKVVLIEAFPMRQAAPPTYDDRSLAISLASCQIMERLGLWPTDASGIVPIERIQVSNLGLFGQLSLDAEDLDLAYFGKVVEARLLGRAAQTRLSHCRQLTILSPARLDALRWLKQSVQLSLASEDGKQTVKAKLLIGADGSGSMVRELCEFSTEEKDYQQQAIVANVTVGRPHDNTAYERLTKTGPLAFLPQTGERCGTVRVCAAEESTDLMDLSESDYLADLQSRFGLRLGQLSRLGKRVSYPLRLIHATEQVRERAVIIGNAAHTVHNIAAQGFNLGLRDVAGLAALIGEAQIQKLDIGEVDLLQTYQERRSADQQAVIRFTDGLISGLAHDSLLPVSLLRSAGLLALDSFGGFKRAFAERAMGFGPISHDLELGAHHD